ncbi:ABC transporter permease [Sediminispirochaeta bajacaliforniensis]|uniref:ABC transporter permease n=1 Tax=Sediminispirochaeta bajacaliforniensis TaxID=148 RepID=UPI00036267CE|nr:ABC transporter permease [Sediminispirochaeta bajacaliforniensis]
MFWHLIFSSSFLFSVLRVSTPIVFAALGALISDRAGIVNIGLEGIMLTAALGGVIGSAYTGSAALGLFFAILSGVLFSAILAWFTLKMKTDVILGGIALNLFASGGTIFLLSILTGEKGTSSSLPSKVLPDITLPLIARIPVLGDILSGHNLLTYVCILSVVGLWYLMNHTPLGFWIRAVGENHHAAESVGIDVFRIRFAALLMSGLFAALGGAFLSMGYVSWFSRDMSAGRGWIALAAEAMGGGLVVRTTITAAFFGLADALANTLQTINLPSELVKTIPYLGTIIGLALYAVRRSSREQKKGRS